MAVEVSKFIGMAEKIAGENPSYRIGGTGKDGTCDCIGLVVGAIRRGGGKWTGRKGTNYAARNEMRELEEIGSAEELRRGEVVLKAHEPGEAGYDAETIARSYASSPDRRDYYHIGIVISPKPLRILHMTSPRAAEDRKIGKWRFHGRLRRVDYTNREAEERTEGEASASEGQETVLIFGGNEALPINQRARATRRAGIIARIPQRAEALLLSRGDGWCRVSWRGRAGYVMGEFIHEKEEAA